MPAKYAYGGFIGLGKQTDFATKATRTDFLPFLDAEITESHGEIWRSTSIDRYDKTPVLGRYNAEMSGTVEVRADDIGLLCLGLFGNLTTSQPDPTNAPNTYKHVFKPQDTLKYLTAELKYGTANISEVLTGLAINELTLEWALELLTAAFRGIAQKPEKLTTPSTPTLSTLKPFAFHQCTLTLAGSSVGVRSGRIGFVNSIDEDDYVSGSRYRAGAEPGKLEGNAEFELYFADMSWVERFWGAAGATGPQDAPAVYACNAKFVGEDIEATYDYTVEVDIPKLFLTEVSKPVSGQDKIVQRIRGRVVVESDTDLPSVTLINTRTGY
jgi:hypothetical protein